MEILGREALEKEAARLAGDLVPHKKGATLITLSGDLGAGKTAFAQAVAKALGVEEMVTSPTFVIEKIYQLPTSDLVGRSFLRLVHIDAYRLSGAHELETLGWKELLADPKNLILLEWPEKVPEAIPGGAIRIRFDIHGDGRTISIDGEESTQG